MGEPSTPSALPARGRRRFTVDALFTDHRPQAAGVRDLPEAKEIRIDRIIADPEQPRTSFDPTKLDELVESIRLEGLLQPIAVRYDPENDIYVILHGERRFRAVNQLGLEFIPAIVRDVPADRRLVQQLMENIVRDDLNAVDRAAALRGLKIQLGDVPWDAVAEHVGIRRSRLFQLLGTEKLPASAQDDLRAGRMNEKQSRALHGLPEVLQEALREAIIAEDLPAAEAMRLSRGLRTSIGVHDLAAAREAVRAARVHGQHASDTETGPLQLLALVAAAARGGTVERSALAAAANAAGASAYSTGQLETRINALAETLARLPLEMAMPDSSARAALTALADALTALLASEQV